MSASAKPVGKVLKSLLAAVLAISLCPLTPVGSAQAEEGGSCDAVDSNESAASFLAADEDEDGTVSPDAEILVPMPESDSGDDGDIASATSVSGKWTTSGTCQWMIDCDGCLTIEPLPGVASGKLGSHSWAEKKDRITSVVIKSKVVSSSDDCRNMFSDFTNLKKADLSGLDTSNATDMSGMFYRCISLTSLDVSKFDTSNVTDMSRMFAFCIKPRFLDVSKFDTSNVTDMSEMFESCEGLTSPDVSKFDTSNVADMNHMFYGCINLEFLDVSRFDTSSVTDMSFMFGMAGKMGSLDLSGFDTSSVTNMSGMLL